MLSNGCVYSTWLNINSHYYVFETFKCIDICFILHFKASQIGFAWDKKENKDYQTLNIFIHDIKSHLTK